MRRRESGPPASRRPASDGDDVPSGFVRTDVEANGTQLNVVVGGSGEPVPPRHDRPRTWRAWRHVMGPSADREPTVVVPDQRGLGDFAPGVSAAGSFRFGLLTTPKTPEFLPGGHERALLTRWFTRLSGSPDVLTAAEQRHHGRLRHRTGRPAARLRALPHPPGRRPGQPGLGQQRRYAPIPVTAMGSVAQRRRARRHATSRLTSPAGVRDRGRWPPSYRRHARRRFCYGQIAFLILKESTAPADAGISGLHRPRRRRPPVRHTGPRAARPLRPPHERAGRPRRRPRP